MADVFMDALKRHVAQFETQYEAAAALGIQPSYLTDILKGRRGPSERLLKALGLKRIITKLSAAERESLKATA